MTALKKEQFEMEADREAINTAVYPPNPQPGPVDYKALRRKAMAQFPKARAYLAR